MATAPTVNQLTNQATQVLDDNSRGGHTVPAEGYSHQWLWDSCFTAIGLRHIDLDRAQSEILSLLRGQWANGMLPHMIFAEGDEHRRDRNMWRSWLNPYAPDAVSTSGITQPPVLAEAIVQVGQKMSSPERHTWYQTFLPALIAYHTWLYTERDPHNEGLVLQVHPWETGLDNTPPWMSELAEHDFSLWIKLATKKPVQIAANFFRRDKRFVMPGQRLSAFEGLALFSVQRRLRRKNYDINKILSHSLFAIEDLSFNCILMRANQHLKDIATSIHRDLPEDLINRMAKTDAAIELFWDAYAGKYYSRDFVTHRLIKVDSIATLLPLYSGAVSKERAAQLVALLHDQNEFATDYPIASVPRKSPWFKQHGYWQGPAWLNTNWLIVDGLRRYGFTDEAKYIVGQSLDMAEKHGISEYYSPIDGTPAGARNFSWTAALLLDFIKSE